MSDAWKTALTVLQETQPDIPPGAHVMTVVIEFPPGDPGTPPHRHPGPAFGYVIEGEMLFELEGESPRVVKAGEAFWEPGGDVIQQQPHRHREQVHRDDDVCARPADAGTGRPRGIGAAQRPTVAGAGLTATSSKRESSETS